MRNWTWRKKTIVGAVLVLAAAAIYIFWPVSEDLSYLLDAGEGYQVRILRDTWGVPHIFGETDADAAHGLAYAHAEDDFFTIQQVLAAAKGVSGQVNGIDAAPIDYMIHLLRIRETVDAAYGADISPEIVRLVEAYADGMNLYAALHEEEVLPGLFPVSGKDVIAGFMQRTPLFFGLDGALGELFAEERQRQVAQKNVSASSGASRSPALSGARLHASIGTGSNTFSVAPSRSANGETFLAINAHQPWEGPVAWYEAHVHSEEGWDATGGLFPGAPLILHGHNRDLGWAFTVNSPDLIDVFVLDINPEEPNQYRFDGEWRELEVRQVPLRVKIAGRLFWTVKREALWSVYGPTVRQDHGTYAIRYASMGEVGYVEQWFRLNKATGLEEWRAAMSDGPIPMFNAGYADKEGNIYYLYNGRIPIRAEGYDWELYLPGDTSETLWSEYLPFEQLPQVLNPSSGFVQNGNSSPFQTTTGPDNPDPADYSSTLGIEMHMTNRGLRALELFGSDESITFDEFYQYKYDRFYSIESEMAKSVRMITEMTGSIDPGLRPAVDLLVQWDLGTDRDNRATALAVLTVQPVLSDSEGVREPGELPDPALLMESLEETVQLLKDEHGRIDVPWGEVNRLRRGNLNLAVGGGPDVLHAVYGRLEEDGRLRGFAGDSYVLLVSWDRDGTVSSQSIHQYGSATLDDSSAHFSDQSHLFVNRELKPVWMDESDILANLEMAYRPGEEIDR
jgi:penicillin amidase/acyl-homoserine-lactone acylase